MPVYDWSMGGLGTADIIDRRTGLKIRERFRYVDTDVGLAIFYRWLSDGSGPVTEGGLYSADGLTVLEGTIRGDFEVRFRGGDDPGRGP